tara:strand:- start:147 stop:857 length:711 start_codon:yes stop_codon:yes gene_type:complete
MSNVIIHPFQSGQPQTPYAPFWDYVIACKQIDLDVKELARVILLEEKVIIEKYSEGDEGHFKYRNESDGYTGLGKDSLTSRFSYYNLLSWDYPVVNDLFNAIKIFHNEYVQGTIGKYVKQPSLSVRCWANVMRKGQQIHKHAHSSHPHSYLSGHFCVQCKDTSTIYYGLYNDAEYPIENVNGQMTLFPTWTCHKTSRHVGDDERITIAFDITPTVVRSGNETSVATSHSDNLITLF